MNKYKIFIVEDDRTYGEMLKYYLSNNEDYEIHWFASAKECLANLDLNPDLITLDYSLPDGTGSEVLYTILQHNSATPVIIISGQRDISTAIELLKSGASDYLVKDDNTKDLLLNSVLRIREVQFLKREVQQLKAELKQSTDISGIVKGNSKGIQKILALVGKAARSSINVTISGETGTGKELLAKAINTCTGNKKAPFVAVHVTAIPPDLLEYELFGYEKGAFVGAVNRRIGRLEEANKGILFLDEIAELDIMLQSKILRALQEMEIVRIGGNEKVKLDFRLITATQKNLAEEVLKGTFREDLYYQVMGLPINLPPLRERGNDILLLAKYFLDQFCKRDKLPSITITEKAKEKLMGYYYPGNVRELKAAIELAGAMCNDNLIQPEDITFNSFAPTNKQYISEEKSLREYNLEILQAFLLKYDNNVQKVAAILDIGKSTIYRMIQEGNLNIGKNHQQ